MLTTRAADGSPHGLTINSFSSISLDPPLVMVSVAHDCTVLNHFAFGSYAVNVLREEQIDLSIRFAEIPEGRFTGVPWIPGITGSPLIDNVLAALDCRIVQTIDAGDHRVFIGELVEARVSEGRPLLFFSSQYSFLS